MGDSGVWMMFFSNRDLICRSSVKLCRVVTRSILVRLIRRSMCFTERHDSLKDDITVRSIISTFSFLNSSKFRSSKSKLLMCPLLIRQFFDVWSSTEKSCLTSDIPMIWSLICRWIFFGSCISEIIVSLIFSWNDQIISKFETKTNWFSVIDFRKSVTYVHSIFLSSARQEILILCPAMISRVERISFVFLLTRSKDESS